MLTLLIILITIVCVLLTLIVLIQNPKGGGIAANFSATNQIMGVKKTSDIVERLTWIFAIALIVLVLATNYIHSAGGSGSDAGDDVKLRERMDNVPVPVTPQPPANQNAQPENGQPAQNGQPNQAQPETPPVNQ